MRNAYKGRCLRPRRVRSVERLGYIHEGDRGIFGREALRREDVPRNGAGRSWPDHHLYACAQDSEDLTSHRAPGVPSGAP